MKKDLGEIHESLKQLLQAQVPALQVRIDTDSNFEVAGTKEVMQGRQKVSGHYFANIVPKPKDIRFYFFPIYTHPDQYGPLSEPLQKSLKGKSCFHIKKLSPEMEEEIKEMIEKGVELYQKDGLI